MPNRDEQLRKAAEIIAGDTSNKTQVHWHMEQLRTEKGGTAWGLGHSEFDMNLTNQLLAPYETCDCFNKKRPGTVVENRYYHRRRSVTDGCTLDVSYHCSWAPRHPLQGHKRNSSPRVGEYRQVDWRSYPEQFFSRYAWGNGSPRPTVIVLNQGHWGRLTDSGQIRNLKAVAEKITPCVLWMTTTTPLERSCTMTKDNLTEDGPHRIRTDTPKCVPLPRTTNWSSIYVRKVLEFFPPDRVVDAGRLTEDAPEMQYFDRIHMQPDTVDLITQALLVQLWRSGSCWKGR
jgi:hypothetical protein